MRTGTIAKGLLEVIIIALVLSLILGQLLGQPLLLSFVTSGSMEPTIGQGDGFVVVPTEIAGDFGVGSVVVFRPATMNDGELTTHRIVDRTDRGFITQGDANPVPDQTRGEPPVKPAQVVAVAFEVSGSPVTIPALGTVVGVVQGAMRSLQDLLTDLFDTGAFLGTQGLAYLLFGLTVILYGVDRYLARGRQRSRVTSRDTGRNTWILIGMMAMAVVLAATLLMIVPSGPTEHDFVSSAHDTPAADVIGVGETESSTLTVRNGGLAPVAVFFEAESDRLGVQPREVRIAGETSASVTLTVTAPDEIGAYSYYVTEYRYLAILPQDHLRAMYRIHPWLPIIVIDALLGIPFYVVGISLVGTGRVRRRTREGPGRVDRLVSRLR